MLFRSAFETSVVDGRAAGLARAVGALVEPGQRPLHVGQLPFDPVEIDGGHRCCWRLGRAVVRTVLLRFESLVHGPEAKATVPPPAYPEGPRLERRRTAPLSAARSRVPSDGRAVATPADGAGCWADE